MRILIRIRQISIIIFASVVVSSVHPRCAAECIGPITKYEPLPGGGFSLQSPNANVIVSGWESGITEINIETKGRDNATVKCQPLGADTAGMKSAPLAFGAKGELLLYGNGSGETRNKPAGADSAFSLRFAAQPGKPLLEIQNVCWDNSGSFKITFKNSRGDHFYGLGEPLPPESGVLKLDYQGRTRTVWNKHFPPADLPINYFYNPRGYGLFIDNYSKAQFDFTDEKQFTYQSDGGRIRFFVIAAKTPADSLISYTALTGRPPMPPLWMLGFMQSRYGYHNADEFNAVMDEFRTRRIPCDAMIFDIDWQGIGGMGNLEWQPQTFPNAENFLEKMESNGFKTIVIVEPYVWSNTKYYMQVRMDKLLCKDEKGRVRTFDLWGRPGSLFDFCNPDTDKFWQGTIKRLHLTGIDGWWTDLNEPDVDFPDMYYAGKTPSALVHNPQPVLMAKSISESYKSNFPNERTLILSRSGGPGIAKYGAAVWSGDVDSSFHHLENQIPIGISAGLSGLPFWGTDMGGFRGHPTPELMVRWFQFGLFCPIFRAHGDHDPREPWAYGPDAEKIMADTIKLRYRLLPHMYTVIREAHEKGLPPIRPLFLVFPDDNSSWSQNKEFMFGDSILAAPVMRPDETAKHVYFPPGKWYDFRSDKILKGTQAITYPATLDTVPIFIREGSIIAMGPVLQHTGQLSHNNVEFHIYPGSKKTEYEYYEDDGTTNEYLSGKFATTKVTAEKTAGGLAVNVAPTKGTFTGLPRNRTWKIVVHGIPGPINEIKLDGKTIKRFQSDQQLPGNAPAWQIAGKPKCVKISVPSSPGGFNILISGWK